MCRQSARPEQGPEQGPAHEAYLHAYELFEAVQGDDPAGAAVEVADALGTAHEAGWVDVAFVLQAASAVYLITRAADGGQTAAAIDALVERAEELAAPAFIAMALGLRALIASAAGDAASLLGDACRAVALLDDDSQPPLDRCVAYVVAAAALNTLRLWELVDELYTRALELDPLGQASRQTAAIGANRVLLRLEWSFALLENGDDAAGAEQLTRVENAIPDALAMDLPPLWRLEMVACRDLVAALRGESGSAFASLREHEQALRQGGDIELLPLLQAAVALALWRNGAAEAAVRAAAELSTTTSATSGAQSFPLWVKAHVLSGHSPTPATEAQREHAALVGRLRWQARMASLTAARSQIAVEHRKAEHDRLTRAVHSDTLTGLQNRRRFEAWLREPLAAPPERTALLLVDLNDFKGVNDTFGHSCGDEVLRRIGQLMQLSVRPGDLAIRQGGDEFALMLHGGHLVEAIAVERAERLVTAIGEERWSEVADGLAVTATIGVALTPPHATGVPTDIGMDAERLYLAADAALYEAKRERRDVSIAPSL